MNSTSTREPIAMTPPPADVPPVFPDPRESLARAWAGVLRARTTVFDTLRLAGRALGHLDRLAQGVSEDSRKVYEDGVALWNSLAHAAGEVQITARSTPRLLAVLDEVARVAAAYRLYQLRAPWLGTRAAAALEAVHTREAERVRDRLQTLGGGLLKLGQLLSTRADILPKAWIDALSTLQDRVPPAPDAEVRAELEPPFGPGLAAFAELAAEPIAAASLAEVRRGRRHADGSSADGADVAVKIRRPGIAEVLAQDEKALAVLAALMPRDLVDIDPRPILAELGRALGDELDFRREAAFADAFAQALSVSLGDRVTVPRPHHDLTTERVLVMDFVEGERLVPFLEAASPEDRAIALRLLAEVTAYAILVHGLVHADPHPGNFLVQRVRRGSDATATEADALRLVVLDFGAVTRLTEAERRAYVELFPAIFGGNEAKVTTLLATLGFSAPDPSAPARFAMTVVRPLVMVDLATVDPKAELERGLALAKAYPGLVVPAAFVQIARALAGLGGLYLRYRPPLDLASTLWGALAAASRPTP